MTAVVTLYFDSGYISLIFALLIQIFLIRSAVKSHILSLDWEVKRRLDKGDHVELSRVSLGPIKINSRLGLKTGVLFSFPAFFIIVLSTLGKLGISGRTIEHYSDQDSLTVGGYFSLYSVNSSTRAPFTFTGIWPKCVDYTDSSVVGHVSTAAYELNDGFLSMKNVVCSETDDVVIYDLSSQCPEVSNGSNGLDYVVTSVDSVVYEEVDRINIFGTPIGNTTITSGKVFVGECNGVPGGPGDILWVESGKSENIYVLVDDSTRIDGDGERWIIDVVSSIPPNEITPIKSSNSKLVIECQEGCLESIIEWCLSGNGIDLRQASVFMSIWFEGLNFGSNVIPSCDISGSRWKDSNGIFKTGDCLDAISIEKLPDGILENVTIFSGWSVSLLSISTLLTFIYFLVTRKNGYGIMGYSGLSKLCDLESNPNLVREKGMFLKVHLENGVVRSTRDLV